ncbi:HPr(Ser) kinase/phosphatase [Risungbinella massiliensis]|uniref:HPr(Ser) kinase/phosphatase n=1 Tax=Risungbinella massiliensis TaxID=1329796 RepID=UPI0005CBC369|nr:HPr(Ser) kinase/phosphatase [Risungbinella massiliensis]
MARKVTVHDIQKKFKLELICGEEYLSHIIHVSDLYRPGLELAGFFTYHPTERLQLLGRSELMFIKNLPDEERTDRLEKFCHPDIPCICITRDLPVPDELIAAAKKNGIPVLRTDMKTTSFTSKLTNFLEDCFAPTTTIHGVLVDVYGMGVVLMGDSGIGKSETALELVKRGHRLVADDAVEITLTEGNHLSGTSPDLIRYLLEIRGLGIINVMTLFGAGAVRNQKRISFVIRLENWQPDRQYDRLGLDEEKIRILEQELPQITVPVRPGRNLAIIIEVAAMNMRMKQLGHNAAEQFVKKLGDTIESEDLE